LADEKFLEIHQGPQENSSHFADLRDEITHKADKTLKEVLPSLDDKPTLAISRFESTSSTNVWDVGTTVFLATTEARATVGQVLHTTGSSTAWFPATAVRGRVSLSSGSRLYTSKGIIYSLYLL
jgi:hypothetical protein